MKASGLSEFMAMGGYGFYVWTSYVVAAVAVALEIVAVRARIRAAVKAAFIGVVLAAAVALGFALLQPAAEPGRLVVQTDRAHRPKKRDLP